MDERNECLEQFMTMAAVTAFVGACVLAGGEWLVGVGIFALAGLIAFGAWLAYGNHDGASAPCQKSQTTPGRAAEIAATTCSRCRRIGRLNDAGYCSTCAREAARLAWQVRQKQQLEQYQEQEQVAAEALREALRERVR